MIVDGILILYTSTPASGQMLTLVAQMKAAGREVFLKPLAHLEKKNKAVVTPALKESLVAVNPN